MVTQKSQDTLLFIFKDYGQNEITTFENEDGWLIDPGHKFTNP